MFPLRDHEPSHKFPIITLILIAINVVVFFLQLTVPDPEVFIYTYALVPSQIDFANVATLLPFLTSMFMHGGFLHIISNMWFLWIFGDNIEATLGHVGFIMFYVLCGMAASLLQYGMNPASSIPMLGASGAIAGVLGGYITLFPRARIDTIVTLGFFLSHIQVPAFIMLGYWFFIQLLSGFGSIGGPDEGGVAFFAHVGGFVAGWVLTKFLIKPRVKWQRIE